MVVSVLSVVRQTERIRFEDTNHLASIRESPMGNTTGATGLRASEREITSERVSERTSENL